MPQGVAVGGSFWSSSLPDFKGCESNTGLGVCRLWQERDWRGETWWVWSPRKAGWVTGG